MNKFLSTVGVAGLGLAVSAQAALTSGDVTLSTDDFEIVAIAVIGAVAVIWGIRKAIQLLGR
ncbi:hypothetical protein AGMMS50229_06930 [Campylobacterota bacterium]|nr:hypothetical protein AGMMS50229_06930 [Campylobacterota bacterium]